MAELLKPLADQYCAVQFQAENFSSTGQPVQLSNAVNGTPLGYEEPQDGQTFRVNAPSADGVTFAGLKLTSLGRVAELNGFCSTLQTNYIIIIRTAPDGKLDFLFPVSRDFVTRNDSAEQTVTPTVAPSPNATASQTARPTASPTPIPATETRVTATAALTTPTLNPTQVAATRQSTVAPTFNAGSAYIDLGVRVSRLETAVPFLVASAKSSATPTSSTPVAMEKGIDTNFLHNPAYTGGAGTGIGLLIGLGIGAFITSRRQRP